MVVVLCAKEIMLITCDISSFILFLLILSGLTHSVVFYYHSIFQPNVPAFPWPMLIRPEIPNSRMIFKGLFTNFYAFSGTVASWEASVSRFFRSHILLTTALIFCKVKKEIRAIFSASLFKLYPGALNPTPPSIPPQFESKLLLLAPPKILHTSLEIFVVSSA